MRKRCLTLALAVMLVSGCDCDERSGTYRITYTEDSGGCGPLPEVITTISGQPDTVSAPCSGQIGYSEDNCEVTNDFFCPGDPPFGDYTVFHDGKYDWSASGDEGEGTMQLRIVDEDGGYVCSSVYAVIIERK